MPFFGSPDIEQLQNKSDIKGLIKALRYKRDLFVRSDAARALGQIGDPDAVESLIAVLNDEDEDSSVRLDVASALGQIGDVRAAGPLITALEDQKFGNRRSLVARALGQIGDACAVEPLIAALGEDDGGGWIEGDGTLLGHTAMALARIGNPCAVEPLIIFLKDRDVSAYRRGIVARALGEFGDQSAIEPLIAALREGIKELGIDVSSALVRIGTSAVGPLIDVLKDEYDIFVQEYAANALGQIGDARALEPLIDVIKNIDSKFSFSASLALAKIGAPAIEPLISVLKDESTEIRTADSVIFALGGIGDARAVEALINTLREGSEELDISIKTVLVKIGTPAVEPLINVLMDENTQTRTLDSVIFVLENIDDQKAKDALEAFADTQEG